MTRKQLFSKKAVKPLLYTPLFIASALGLYSANNWHAANIIFDLGGVLVNVSSFAMYRCIGLFKLFSCAFGMRKNPRSLFFKMLDEIDLPDIRQHGVCDESGRPLPKGMIHWFRGTASSVEIQSAVERLLGQHSSDYNLAEKRFIKLVTNSVFDPEKLASIVRFEEEALAFLQNCIKQGHKLYVLSNWDSESFNIVRKRYSEIFDLFDGILISGQAGLVKPDPTIFYYLLNRYRLDPRNSVFIDNQEENIQAAGVAGIHGIRCPKTDGWFARQNFEEVRACFDLWQLERALNNQQEKRRSIAL